MRIFVGFPKIYLKFWNLYSITMVFYLLSPIILPILIDKDVHLVRIRIKINYKSVCAYFPFICLTYNTS